MNRKPLVATAVLAALPAAVLAGCAPQPDASDGPTDPRIDAIFADLAGDRPGAAVGVVMGGEVVHRAGYGTAHMDHGIPITPGTVFDIASISKQFGAIAALLLQSEGNLDLDADVRTYVPELPDFGAVITARHLIHHTSGIRDWPHTMALGGIGFTDVISFEKILRMLQHQQAINFPPNSEYAYSNTGYNLLARVIEVQSGMTFREYTESRIFGPLGMTRTHFSDDYLEVVPGRAESYAPMGLAEGLGEGETEGEGFQRLPNQLTALASSSLHTSIDDFIRWMRNYETAQVGGEEMLRTMVQPGVLTGGDTLEYAYGLSVGDYRGLTTFGHGGSWVGYRTNFTRFPEQNLSIAIFCNVSDCDPAGRARRVAEVYIGDLMAEAPEAPEPEPDAEGPSLTAEQLREYEGSYRSPELDSTYDLKVNGEGRLVASHWRNDPSVLMPTGEDEFTGDQWFLPEVRFVRDGAGRVSGFTVTGVRVRDLIFERQP
ncbi:MAG: serine hydrolase [Gemmatimonadota bacterium]|nr:serine hydrolase [Gemmatimonadota bacterium]